MDDTNKPRATCLVARYILDVLADEAAYEAARRTAIAAHEARGHRIVNGGGQVAEDGETATYTDWRTGEVLYSGSGTAEEVRAGLAKADPGDRWWHIDNVEWEVLDARPTPSPPIPDALPAGLADAIQDWVRTNPDQARAFADDHAGVVTPDA